MELERILGNINAQYATSRHLDLPSEVKVLQTESSLKDSAGLAERLGMVHYISTQRWTQARTSVFLRVHAAGWRLVRRSSSEAVAASCPWRITNSSGNW